MSWSCLVLQGSKSEKKRRRRGKKEQGVSEGPGGKEGKEAEELEQRGPVEVVKEIVADDGTVMTIKEVIPGTVVEEESEEEDEGEEEATCAPMEPCPRSSGMAAVKHGKLYLYGGMFEVGDRQVTLGDLYALDFHKMDQWEVLVEMDPSECPFLCSLACVWYVSI